MKKGVFIIFVSIFCTILINSTQAETKKFVIGVENISYYPHYTYENNQYKGFARDVLDAFAKEKGYTFEYRAVPVNRLFKDLIDGVVDFKYPDNPQWQGDLKKGKNILYSSSVVNFIDGVSVLPANKGKGKAALKQLGTVMGFTPWEYLGDIKSGNIKLSENPKMDGLVMQGLAGRVDGVYANVAIVNYQLVEIQKKPGGLVFDESLPHSKGSYFLSTIKYPVLIKEFNQFISQNKDLINRLKSKYKVEEGIH